MKKIISIFLVVLMLLSFSVVYADQQPEQKPPAYQNEKQPYEVTDSPTTGPVDSSPLTYMGESSTASGIRVYVNDAEVGFPDAQPYIKNDRTLVPVRFVSEQLGAQVSWDEKSKQVTIEKDGKKIILRIGSKEVLINGNKVALDVPAEIKNERTMVPLRFISEAFGANVDWNGKEKVVTIETKK